MSRYLLVLLSVGCSIAQPVLPGVLGNDSDSGDNETCVNPPNCNDNDEDACCKDYRCMTASYQKPYYCEPIVDDPAKTDVIIVIVVVMSVSLIVYVVIMTVSFLKKDPMHALKLSQGDAPTQLPADDVAEDRGGGDADDNSLSAEVDGEMGTMVATARTQQHLLPQPLRPVK